MPDKGVCKSCGKPIVFVRSASGQLISLDADPSQDGTWEISTGEAIRIKETRAAPLFGLKLHQLHSTICDHSKEERKT